MKRDIVDLLLKRLLPPTVNSGIILIVLISIFNPVSYSEECEIPKNRLYLCYYFGYDFEMHDKSNLWQFLSDNANLREWVDFVLVTYDSSQCPSCSTVARQLNIDYGCMNETERLSLQLKHAPSFSLVFQTNIVFPIKTFNQLRSLSNRMLVPRGDFSLTLPDDCAYSKLLLRCEIDTGIQYILNGDTTLTNIPVGPYIAYDDTNEIELFCIREDSMTSYTCQSKVTKLDTVIVYPDTIFQDSLPPVRDGQEKTLPDTTTPEYTVTTDTNRTDTTTTTPPLPQFPSPPRRRSITFDGSIGFLNSTFSFDSIKLNPDFTAGLALRYTGRTAINFDGLFDKDFHPYLILATLEISIANAAWIEWSIKGGYTFSNDPYFAAHLGINDAKYSEIIYGTSLFFGHVGFGKSKRFGINLDVLYSQEIEYSATESEPPIFGGFTLGVMVQVQLL